LAAVFAGAFFRATGFAVAGPVEAVTAFAVLAAAALVRGARVPAAALEPLGVLATAASGAG
jgi:hypothetical protein